MIDDQLHRLQRIDCFGFATHRCHRVAHRGQIDDTRNAGEILQQHSRRSEGNLAFAAFAVPARQRFDIFFGDRAPVFEAQQILQENLERKRHPLERRYARSFQGVEPVVRVGAIADAQRVERSETIGL